jgi:pyrrolidone-carboxylate peptidase
MWRMPIVIVAGYEAWKRASENPTLDILEKLQSLPSIEADLVTIRVPVDGSISELI